MKMSFSFYFDTKLYVRFQHRNTRFEVCCISEVFLTYHVHNGLIANIILPELQDNRLLKDVYCMSYYWILLLPTVE